MNLDKGCFECPLEVRDYELDMQGIVNNAVYLHYFEHARHKYLRYVGLDFETMHKEGLDAVVHHLEITYKHSLHSGDKCTIRLSVAQEGKLRIVFTQQAVKEDGSIAADARVVVVFTCNGKPVPPNSTIAALLLGKA